MGFFNTILAGSNALKMLGLGVHNLPVPGHSERALEEMTW